MRNTIYVLFILTMSGLTFGQITITSQEVTNFFAPGIIQTHYSSGDLNGSVSMDIGIAGPNAQSWIHPQVAFEDTAVQTCITPSSSGYQAQFPNATHTSKSVMPFMEIYTMEMFSFFQITTTELRGLGSVQHIYGSGIDTTIFYYEDERQLMLPLSMGTTYVSYYDSSESTPGFWNVEEVTKTVDAHGTVSLFGNSAQSLRMKSTTAHRVYQNSTLINSWFQRDYQWISLIGVLNADADTASQTSGNVPLESMSITTIANSTGVEDNSLTANSFDLLQNYPNPFNPSTTISFSIPSEQYVSLKVYDVLGNEVASLINEDKQSGVYHVNFDASKLSSGLYVYKLNAGSYSQSKKMMLLK